MSYTVKQLATLSGVSPRTLRFYDEIGLLKPGSYGENNYRYYGEEQLLLLQQILFFRELGFPLKEIQGFMNDPSFDKLDTLATHKISLQENLEKTKALIKTINKTVAHLKGEEIMNTTNLYDSFSEKIKNAADEHALEMKHNRVDNGLSKKDEIIIEQATEKAKTWSPSDFAKHLLLGDELFKELVENIEKKYAPESDETQFLVSKHYDWVKLMNGNISKHGYDIIIKESGRSTALSDYYTNYHPELEAYLYAAMTAFITS